jgi:hypothetical protein
MALLRFLAIIIFVFFFDDLRVLPAFKQGKILVKIPVCIQLTLPQEIAKRQAVLWL